MERRAGIHGAMSAPTTPTQPVMLSAIQPTNPMTLGNFVGAMRNWTQLQATYDSLFFAVDQHAITVRQDPSTLRAHTYRLMATFIAAGLDPDRCTLFVQSHVPEHTELGWILLCHSYMGELSRMTQFKDKSARQGENIPAGLFAYPALMAADILLYQTDVVPVGDDQKQHVELTRDIAERMNNAHGRSLFKIPKAWNPKYGARVMSLQDPTKKMSKSDPDPKATVFLTDDDKTIAKKLKGAVTDSGTEITYTDDKPGIKNLIQLQCALTGETAEQVVSRYVGKMYGHLKLDTAEIIISTVGPIRDEAQRLLSDLGELDRLLKKGADKARARAALTLDAVRAAVGFTPRPI
jgi:tryptophanyl-tRNA synthetase